MKRTLWKIASAVVVTVWSGLVGALIGLGCFFLYPAQYRSTARVVVGADRAPAVLAVASSPSTLASAVLVAELFNSERDTVALDALVKRLPFTVSATSAGAATRLDLSMTYADRYRVQRALDSVVRHMISEVPKPWSPGGAFAPDSRNATAAVRSRGVEPAAALLAGFVAGILLYSVYVQVRYRPTPAASAKGAGEYTDRISRTISSRDVKRLSS